MAAAKYKDAIVDFIQNDKKLTESVVQASATNDNANVDELTMDLAAMLASHAHHLQEQHDANNNNNSNNDNANGAKISAVAAARNSRLSHTASECYSPSSRRRSTSSRRSRWRRARRNNTSRSGSKFLFPFFSPLASSPI